MSEPLLALKNSSNAFSTSDRVAKRELKRAVKDTRTLIELGFANLRKSSKSTQKPGDEITLWYGVGGAWAGGRMSPSSRLRATSIGGGPSRNGVRVLGEGDKITEGTLRWRPGPVPGSSVVEVGSSAEDTGSGTGISNLEGAAD